MEERTREKADEAVEAIMDKIIEYAKKPAVDYMAIESLAKTAVELHFSFKAVQTCRVCE